MSNQDFAVWVDYNDITLDYETIGILLDLDGLYFKGSPVTTGDDEGNRAEGVITKMRKTNEGTLVHVRLDLNTFRGEL